MKDKVEQALAKIRPMLRADGGDVKLVSVDEKTGVVRVTLTGACGCCPGAAMTLKMVLERKLKEEVPGVTQVVPA
ncbi:MAG: NifU family protein [Elusimicrobiales bacterium]|nr:NifU family protein [Elusimicrobiales bacterium]